MNLEWTLIIVGLSLVIVTEYLVYSVHRIVKNSLKTVVLKRRFDVYDATGVFICDVIKKGKVEEKSFEEFRKRTFGYWLLFGNDVQSVLNEVYCTSTEMMMYEKKEKEITGELNETVPQNLQKSIPTPTSVKGLTLDQLLSLNRYTGQLPPTLVKNLTLNQLDLYKRVFDSFLPYLDFSET